MKKLTKNTIQPGIIVTVINASHKFPGFDRTTELIGYEKLLDCSTPQIIINVHEKLKIIGLRKDYRAVTYKRLLDNKIYHSFLGHFTSFVRII